MKLLLLCAFAIMTGAAMAQPEPPGELSQGSEAETMPSPKVESESTVPAPAPTPKKSKVSTPSAQLQDALDAIAQSNRDLLDLLKKQQGVLQDMQFDRRLQSRQIQMLEERLENTMYENTQLQKQIATLEANAAQPRPAVAASPDAPVATPTKSPATEAPSDNPPPAPISALPPAPTDAVPGTPSWHRLFTLKGTDPKQSDPFHIQGHNWRVVWHNQDPPSLTNTSALFVSAFPKDDTIPQKVCAKLGTGGDATELLGPGHFYLKIEASGGSWELAVEEFQ